MANKYASLNTLSAFLENIKRLFATKADVDTILPSAKSYSDTCDASVLESSQSYTDNAVSQKSQVQLITLEEGD
jgi:hypothetical protein